MKYILILLLTITSLHSFAAGQLSQDIRNYIQIYEEHYPRTELYYDILKMQSSSPQDKLGLAQKFSGKMHGIYSDYEIQYKAQSIAKNMDPTGPFNDYYKETVAELMQIYLNEPTHRRAVQSLFDAISMTYHNKSQKEQHHDRMTSWTKHLLDYSEWTWGVAILWSLRTNPTFINSNKWYVKPFSKPMAKIPLPKRLTNIYKKKSKKPIQEMGYFRRVGHHLAQRPTFKALGNFTKNIAMFSGITAGTAAVFGTPAYFIYRAKEHRQNPETLAGAKLQQMAILELGCRAIEITQDIQSIKFDKATQQQTLELGQLLKAEINDLVDARRFLYETAYFYATSQKLNKAVKWNSETSEFNLESNTLECKALAGRKKVESGQLNLNAINRLMNSNIKLFDEKFNDFMFKTMDLRIDELFGTTKTTSGNYDVIPEEKFNSQTVNIVNSLTYLALNKMSISDVSPEVISKIEINSEIAQNTAEVLTNYLLKSKMKEKFRQLTTLDQNGFRQLAQDISYEWPSSTFSSYITHIVKTKYLTETSHRNNFDYLFYAISDLLESERNKKILPDAEAYIDPLLFSTNLNNSLTSEAAE